MSVDWKLLVLLVGCVLIACACGKRAPTSFAELYRSDMGLEISLDMTQDEVREVLGPPQAISKIQYGASITESYLPKEVTAAGGDTPQLTLTYFDGKLARVFNRWCPEDPEADYPPYFVELLPGMKLGCRKSDTVTALGLPEHIGIFEWEFAHRDGRSILITAHFTELPGTADQLMSSLLVVLIPVIPESRGEEAEKRDDWRKDLGLE